MTRRSSFKSSGARPRSYLAVASGWTFPCNVTRVPSFTGPVTRAGAAVWAFAETVRIGTKDNQQHNSRIRTGSSFLGVPPAPAISPAKLSDGIYRNLQKVSLRTSLNNKHNSFETVTKYEPLARFVLHPSAYPAIFPPLPVCPVNFFAAPHVSPSQAALRQRPAPHAGGHL